MAGTTLFNGIPDPDGTDLTSAVNVGYLNKAVLEKGIFIGGNTFEKRNTGGTDPSEYNFISSTLF